MPEPMTWDAALDDLENHLTEAEALLDGEAAPAPRATWVKPHGLGPLPPHLVERAFKLRERQAALIAAIPAAMAETRAQQAAAERHQGGRRIKQPDAIYIDVSA